MFNIPQTEEVTETGDEFKATGEGNLLPTTLALPDTQPTPPPTYSIIFDNMDFFLRASHQSSLRSNQNLHWIHHIAVQDRIPTHHITNKKTVKDILQYDLSTSLP